MASFGGSNWQLSQSGQQASSVCTTSVETGRSTCPKGDMSVMLPTIITFNEEGDLTGDFFEPEPIRSGRP